MKLVTKRKKFTTLSGKEATAVLRQFPSGRCVIFVYEGPTDYAIPDTVEFKPLDGTFNFWCPTKALEQATDFFNYL